MKWAILATGRIAKKFATTLNQMNAEGEELVAVGSRELSHAEDFAKEFGIPRAYGSYEELVQDPEVDVVYVATPNNFHKEHTKLCLEHGKNVLCEKPFTMKGDDAKELYELAAKKGLFLMEAFWIALLPVYDQMKTWIQEGRIGQVMKARVDYGYALSADRRHRKFGKEFGGGALLDVGVYNLGFLYMVFGKNPDSFQSFMHQNEYETDDFSFLELNYGEGKSAQLTTAIGLDLGRKAYVAGTEGFISLEDFQMAQKISLHQYNGEVIVKEFPFDINGFEYQIRETAANIQAGRSSSLRYTPQASIDTCALMEQILSSWA